MFGRSKKPTPEPEPSNTASATPTAGGRCLTCGGTSNGNAYCPTCWAGRGQCAPNCVGCVMDAVEQGR